MANYQQEYELPQCTFGYQRPVLLALSSDNATQLLHARISWLLNDRKNKAKTEKVMFENKAAFYPYFGLVISDISTIFKIFFEKGKLN